MSNPLENTESRILTFPNTEKSVFRIIRLDKMAFTAFKLIEIHDDNKMNKTHSNLEEKCSIYRELVDSGYIKSKPTGNFITSKGWAYHIVSHYPLYIIGTISGIIGLIYTCTR